MPSSPSDYVQAHKKVWRAWGSATAYPCILCGGAAEEWAFQYPEGVEYLTVNGRRPFTNNPEHYEPMCRSCHTKYDRAMDPSDSEMIRRDAVSQGMRKMANTRRNVCDECSLVANPGAVGVHQKHTGHRGFWELS